MIVKSEDDPVDDLAVGAAAAFHMDVGLGVKRPAFFREPFERLPAVHIVQQGPVFEPSGPVGQEIDRCIQPDGDRAAVEKLSRTRVDEGLAAGRDDPDVAVHKPCNDAPFAVAEVRLPESFVNLGGRVAWGALGDGGIGIHEGNPEPLREAAADRRLAGPHQANKDNRSIKALGQVSHGQGYTGGCRAG